MHIEGKEDRAKRLIHDISFQLTLQIPYNYSLLRITQIYLTLLPFVLIEGIWIKHWEEPLLTEQINSFMIYIKGKRTCHQHDFHALYKMLSSSCNFDLFSIINESNAGSSHKSGSQYSRHLMTYGKFILAQNTPHFASSDQEREQGFEFKFMCLLLRTF